MTPELKQTIQGFIDRWAKCWTHPQTHQSFENDLKVVLEATRKEERERCACIVDSADEDYQDCAFAAREIRSST